MKTRAFFLSWGLVVVATGLVACSRHDSGGHPSQGLHVDSVAGEAVQQYSIVQSAAVWLTDSNIVALASIVTRAPESLALAEAQRSTNERVHKLGLDILHEHTAFQTSIDSLAGKRHIPSQPPAIAPSIQAPYDSAVAAFAAVPSDRLSTDFLTAQVAMHERTTMDFAAMAGNAIDPDLRALLISRAVSMEQQHLARIKLLAKDIAEDDSLKRVRSKP